MSEEKKSWRAVYKIHPAADLFPRLPEDELRKLGEDIKANGLLEPIALWSTTLEERDSAAVVLDGINRLDGMELVGIETIKPIGGMFRLAVAPRYLSFEKNLYVPSDGGVNPFSYAISKNAHRRHLSKEQRADLILKALKLEQEQNFASMRSSETRQFYGGSKGGSTKEPLKEKFVHETAKQGIGKATAQRVWDKDRGPQFERTPPQPAPRTDIPNVAIDRIARDAITFLEPKFNNLRQSDIAQVLTAVTKHFQNGAAPTEIFYRKGKPRTDIFDQRPPWEFEE